MSEFLQWCIFEQECFGMNIFLAVILLGTLTLENIRIFINHFKNCLNNWNYTNSHVDSSIWDILLLPSRFYGTFFLDSDFNF